MSKFTGTFLPVSLFILAITISQLLIVPRYHSHNETAISPDGKYAYISGLSSNKVTIIEANLWCQIKVLTVGDGPHGYCVQQIHQQDSVLATKPLCPRCNRCRTAGCCAQQIL